ncbi:hypothetical protein [Shewanella sp. YLB-07]|uniref:hypothetical protein n=1 Tax=Shewanella sp. YLB-07 TaxID=2601268 RepID=UPI00128DDDBB|nr:hypothetical protein [Shewanella sp. YLB-07]MPY24861.1 hypothetical protein [Shewanella sp. YLB-07]
MKLKLIGTFTLLSYVNQLGNVLINFLFIGMLTPLMLGDIALAKIWMRSVDYGHLGLRHSIDRYTPIWDIHSNSTLLFLTLLITSISFIIISICALLFLDDMHLVFSFLLWGYALSVATVLKNFNRALSQDKEMMIVYTFCPVILTISQALVLFLFGFDSFLSFTIVISLVSVFYLINRNRFDMKYSMKSSLLILSKVKSSSFLLLVNSIILFFGFAVDRIFLASFSDKTVLGLYSIALFAFSLMQIVPTTVSQFFFPDVTKKTVRTNKIFYPREFTVIAIPTITTLILVYCIIPFGLEFINKEYLVLVEPTRMVTFAVLPYVFIPIFIQVFNALDKRKELILVSLLSIVIYTFLLFITQYYVSDFLGAFIMLKIFYSYFLCFLYLVFLIYINRTGIKVFYKCGEETH